MEEKKFSFLILNKLLLMLIMALFMAA